MNNDSICRLILIACSLVAQTARANTNLQFKAEASFKETFDSNIYLQDVAPSAAGVAAAHAAGLHPAEADQSSFVSSVVPALGIEYKPWESFHFSAGYAPEITFYQAASAEDYVTHRGTLNFGGKAEDLAWELTNIGTYIDGNTEGPVYARPGDVPALGAIPVRDRRAAFIYRSGFRLTETIGKWFIRPVASAYVHDFKTDQQYNAPANRLLYVYENYIDRQDIGGGLDVGYAVMEDTHVVLGYRYGRQDQFDGPYGVGGKAIDSPFDCAYNRVLVGVEGTPAKWMKVAIAVGPDIRDFSAAAHRMYPTFDPDTLLYFLDASLTLIPTRADSITVRSTRFEQPAFSSFSMYEDVKTDIAWRHQFTSKFTAGLGFTLYIGDWQAPAHRNDWVYTPNAALTYAITDKLSAEAFYSYDWVDSKVSAQIEPFTAGHQFTRHLATIGLRYHF